MSGRKEKSDLRIDTKDSGGTSTSSFTTQRQDTVEQPESVVQGVVEAQQHTGQSYVKTV